MSNAKQHAAEIVRTLREHGHQAYFAGGCVRDLLLSREPADYDVATEATPRQVMQIFPQTYAVGEQFGVVLVPEAGGEAGVPSTSAGQALARQGERGKGAVEVATFRSDVGYSDGRHPDEVRFSKDPREDVQRRDFTINGMMLDPATHEILDFVGGRDDLKAGIVGHVETARSTVEFKAMGQSDRIERIDLERRRRGTDVKLLDARGA